MRWAAAPLALACTCAWSGTVVAPRSLEVRQRPGEPQAVFVKDGNVMSPVAIVSAGRVEAFASNAQPYFAPGRPFYLYGGGNSGKAVAAGPKRMSCESQTGTVQVSAGPDVADGVLTNFALGPQGPAARAPTADERRLIAQMAKQLLHRYSVPPHYIALLLDNKRAGVQRQQSLAALELPGKAKPLLFASYALDWALGTLRGSYALTFIVEPNETGIYLPTYRDFDATEGESSGETRKFIANVDLNGDGSDELILTATGGERWWYEVLSRVNGKWTLAAKGGGGGC